MAVPVQHTLYVLGAPGVREQNVRLLTYIKNNKDLLRRMGVSIRVVQATASQLKSGEVRAALKGRGIKELPALVTAKSVYLGVAAIVELYEKNIKEFTASLVGGGGGGGGDSDSGDPARDWLLSNIAVDDGDDGGDDISSSEANGMMAQYHSHVKRRSGGGRPAAEMSGGPVARDAPPNFNSAGIGGARRDNVALPHPPPRVDADFDDNPEEDAIMDKYYASREETPI